MKKQLHDYLSKIISHFVPTQRDPILSEREEPLTVIPYLSADLVASILAETEDGYTERLFTLYRDIMVDSHLLAEFGKRKIAVLKEIPSFTPYDKAVPDDVAARDEIERMWGHLKGKREALTHLLDSTLYPVAVIEKVWKPSRTPGRAYEIDRLVPVPHHLLDYREGHMRLRRVDQHGRRTEEFYRPDPLRYIIHRGHLLTGHPDKWGGPMRALLFWFLFKTMNREWWARFLDRFGSPFIVGKYQDGDARSRSELAHAFSQATRIFGLVIPNESSVELVQSAATQSGDAFAAFHAVANAEMSKLIVGQTMTTEAKGGGGLGEGQAAVHQGVRDDIQGFDASALAETLSDQLFEQHLVINGYRGHRPSVAFGGLGQADAKAVSELLKSMGDAGFEPGDDAEEFLSHAAGFPVRRKVVIDPPASPFLLSADATSQLAGNAAARVSQALRERQSDLPRLIASSSSPGDLEDLLIARLGRSTGPAAEVIADVLAAGAVSGLDRVN